MAKIVFLTVQINCPEKIHQAPSDKIKKDHNRSCSLFLWGARWDCLGFFALNVSTDFLFVRLRILQRKVLRTLQKIRSNPDQAPLGRVSFNSTITQNKKHSNKCHCVFYGAGCGTKSEPDSDIILLPDSKVVKYFKTNIENLFNNKENILLLQIITNKIAVNY